VVISFPDKKGNPAFIAHWTIELDPGEFTLTKYPLVAEDDLEISMFFAFHLEETPTGVAYIEDPRGNRIVDVKAFTDKGIKDTKTEFSGMYSIYVDNTQSTHPVTMHLLITYHVPAPGSGPY
jgi:hypothetical protein